MAKVILKRGRSKPLWYGHPWVFSDAIAEVEGDPDNGDRVEVVDAQGRLIGEGYFSGRSQIRVRMLTHGGGRAEDGLLRARLEAAWSLRQDLGLPSDRTTGYRLVHGEGDGLPGLVVDAFDDVLVVQFLASGMKRREAEILDALEGIASPQAIVEAASPSMQKKEGFTVERRIVRGEEFEGTVSIVEDGLCYVCDVLRGQKTGYYFDQRDNRRVTASFAAGRRVLDAYCYSGSFAIGAARGGARQVVGVDSSAPALTLAALNAEQNGVEVDWVQEDVARFLREMAGHQSFDLVVLDPPKFAPRAEVTGDALRAYRAVNTAAMRVIDDGVLATASCSQRVGEQELVRVLAQAAKEAQRSVQVLEVGHQAPDHPWLAACPEGRYLTMFFCRIRAL